MPDLVEKYFGMDLSQAEQESLSELLLGSDEAALKFEAAAKEAYFRYGLPDPEPRWKDEPPPSAASGSGVGPWIWTLALVFGITALGWWFRPWTAVPKFFSAMKIKGATDPQASSAPRDPSVSKAGHGKKQAGSSRLGEKAPVPAKKEIFEDQVGLEKSPLPLASGAVGKGASSGPQVKAQGGSAVNAPLSKAIIPVPVDPNSSKSFPYLSVVVEQSDQRLVGVRVIDNRGAEVVDLYRGNLAPGNWIFEWDGKQPGGKPAIPGYYQIEVKSGSYVQRKPIQIQ